MILRIIMPLPDSPPDAEQLCAALAAQMQPHLDVTRVALVGIHTGGVWVAERLHKLLNLTTPIGAIDVAFHRDDYGQNARHGQHGLPAGARPSHLPFEVEGAHIVIVDDVLYTGRTIRAALNELFDYGRPAKVELAVLVDRGGRELPIAADYCAHGLRLPPAQTLELTRAADGPDSQLSFRLTEQ